MWKTTVGLGVLLELLGIGSYGAAVAGLTGRPPSLTALIPAAVGSLFILLGLLARKPDLRKHVMHAAAALALLLGGAGIAMAIKAVVGGFKNGMLAFSAQLIMGLLCLIFVFLCVQSFRAVRKAAAA